MQHGSKKIGLHLSKRRCIFLNMQNKDNTGSFVSYSDKCLNNNKKMYLFITFIWVIVTIHSLFNIISKYNWFLRIPDTSNYIQNSFDCSKNCVRK